MFGFEVPLWLGIPVTLGLFGLVARRTRTLPIWGLYGAFTLLMFVGLGSTPRYALMALPMLLVEWALLCHALARWLIPLAPWRFTPDWAMLITLAVPTVIHLALSGNLILEQRGHHYKNGFRHTDFLVCYRDGEMLAFKQLADAIRQHVPQGRRVLGPEGRITSFLSGREVFDSAELFSNKPGPQWAPTVHARKITWIAWGPRFRHEIRTVKLLRPAPREPLLQIDSRAWWTIEPVGKDPAGLPKGMFLGRLYSPPSAMTTRSANRPAEPPLPMPWKKLPGLELPPVAKHRAATRPARQP